MWVSYSMTKAKPEQKILLHDKDHHKYANKPKNR